MKTRSFLSTSLALGVFASTFLLPAPAFARVPQAPKSKVAPPTVTPTTKAQEISAQKGYIKAVRGRGGSFDSAQTVIRRFTPLHGNGPSISLVAAVHIGEKSYYKQIQQFLDKQDVVLYEGVKVSRTPTKTKPTAGSKPRVGIQKKMSDALQLQYQLEGIHYNRPQFRNSDLDWDTLNTLATKAGPDTLKLLSGLKNSVGGGPTITTSDQIVDQVLSISASTPFIATMMRRLLIRALSAPDNSPALTGKNQAPAQKLDFIIVNERNKAVLTDIKALLKTSKRTSPRPVRSIAVFYGAAHMGDIEQHLISDLGYRSADARWITAIQATH